MVRSRAVAAAVDFNKSFAGFFQSAGEIAD